MTKKQKTRFWEIDTLRGIAIIMMIVYHIIFDLYFLEVYDFNIHSIGFKIFLYPIGTLFLLLVGVSLTISYNREKNRLNKKNLFKKFVLRGLKIFVLGLMITVVTWFYLDRGFIVFGVLHCIGVSMILSCFFIRYRYLNLVFGVLIISFGILLRSFTFDFNWLVWVGFIPAGFYTIDYFPLLPWFGVVLIGVFFGNLLYFDGKRFFSIKDLSENRVIGVLCFLGRNSLVIYFLHQPLIIGLIYLIF